MKHDIDSRRARLSIDDLDQLACAWRHSSMQGDRTTCAIADALESVVRQRRAVARSRSRVRTARRALLPLRKAARWAASRC